MAAEETILSWTVSNWITVVLMAAVAFAVVGLGVKVYQRGQSAKSEAK